MAREPEPPVFRARYSAATDEMAADGRLISPSFHKNVAPIREVLAPLLVGRIGTLLEVAAGTGHHAAHLAAAFSHLDWLPSDLEPAHLASIEAWRAHLAVPSQCPAVALDATADWTAVPEIAARLPLTAVYAQNLLHIAPWTVAEGLMAGAARCLSPGAPLLIYGPFSEGGRHVGEGNARFDAALRAQDRAWGLRDVDDLDSLARASGLKPDGRIRMPSNNRMLIYRR